MKHIESRQNPYFQQLLRWRDHTADRSKDKVALLEGIHVCSSWVDQGHSLVQWLINPEAMQHHEIQKLVDRIPAEIITLSPARMRELSEHPHPTGLMALARRPEHRVLQSTHAVIIDRIQDPGNLGTLLRTAAAAGVGLVFIEPGSTDPFSPRCLRAGMGAQAVLVIEENYDPEAWKPRQLVATSLSNSISIYDADLQQPTAWIFGNEGQGIASEWLNRADVRIHIPMHPGMESLNVAAAAAVCLFEQRRQDMTSLKHSRSGTPL